MYPSQYVRSLLTATGPYSVYMNDDAYIYKNLIARQYLESETLLCMEWPLRLHVFSPIGPVWRDFIP